MNNFKPLDLFGNSASPQICSEQSVMPSSNETLTKNDKNKGLDAKKECESADSKSGMESDDCKKGSSEEMVAENEQQTVAVVNDSDSKENTESEESALSRIESLYEHLSEQISDMETLFTKRIMHTDYEDKVIDRMHDELQKYKEDLYSQLIKPILLDVIEVRDSIMRIAATYLNKPEGEQCIPNKIFADYAYDLQDILEKNNVEIYRSGNGTPFVPVKQRVVKKEITDDESFHGKIAESLSSGYSYGERVISAEKVSVYFYQESGENKNESEDN